MRSVAPLRLRMSADGRGGKPRVLAFRQCSHHKEKAGFESMAALSCTGDGWSVVSIVTPGLPTCPPSWMCEFSRGVREELTPLNRFWLIAEFDICPPQCKVSQRSERNVHLRTTGASRCQGSE